MEVPNWLTIQQACRLTGWDAQTMREIVGGDNVDLNSQGLIEKQSLYDFQECLALVLHWHD